MCGKFIQMKDWEAMVELAQLIQSVSLGLTETVTPMRVASVIRLNAAGAREVARMRWGFVPANARDQNIGTQFIHARAETIEEKPTYRDAFFNRRGLVIVRSFNEGKEITPTKTEQHVITPRDGKPLAIAVIWERWTKMPLRIFRDGHHRRQHADRHHHRPHACRDRTRRIGRNGWAKNPRASMN